MINPPAIDLRLPGCAPVPLAYYLKALGILRLVSQQRDANAKGFWKNDIFHLVSALDRDALVNFFLNEYRPTPIIAPWNGGSGFYFQEAKLVQRDPLTRKKIKTGERTQATAATEVVDKILKSSSDRFAEYRRAIQLSKESLSQLHFDEAPDGPAKDSLINLLRSRLSDNAVRWMDAVCILLASDDPGAALGAAFPPLLGTGGNDGNTDFTSNFMQRLTEMLETESGNSPPDSVRLLEAALFSVNARGAKVKAAIGQFLPGFAGGPNNAPGFSGSSFVNPWDFIFLMEGSLLFAAASARQLERLAPGMLVAPFCVRQAGVGYASAGRADEDHKRPAEIWAPIWSTPTTLPELEAVFSEGRAQIGGRLARNGVDFARAVVTLGVERGFDAFQRYGFLQRFGKLYFATPLERIPVERNARADLLSDIDSWLDRFRSKAGPSSNAPASVTRALRQVEEHILDLCKNDRAENMHALLVALGACERALARSERWAKESAQPIFGLAPRWLRAADTGSPEFRLAAALASTSGIFGNEFLPLRAHLEPAEIKGGATKRWAAWLENKSNDVVWREGAFIETLNAIFSRRLVLGQQGEKHLADRSVCPVHFSDLTALIDDDVDDELIGELLWGLALLDWQAVKPDDLPAAPSEPEIAPSAFYALLKLCFTRPAPDEEPVPLMPAIHRRAARGDGASASALAARRLRAGGFAPAVEKIPVAGQLARRTAAALLFPLRNFQIAILRKTILRPELEPAAAL
jgi:CRISPR-associated protein Csx17